MAEPTSPDRSASTPRDPRAARRIVRASIAAAAVLILGAGILRGLRESARAAAPSAASADPSVVKGR
jgi:hypothetical protein